MKHPSLILPRQIRLTVATVGLNTLRVTAHLVGDEAKVVVDCPDSMPPAVLLTCLAALEQYIREQTGCSVETAFGSPAVEAL